MDAIIKEIVKEIEWAEIVYVLAGAIIGFFASIFVLILERILDRKGKMTIFYRRTNQRGSNGRGWGFDHSGDGRVYFTVPMEFELQNTSNTTRVIRDVSLLLYDGINFVAKMRQLEGIHITSRTGNTITGEKDYSFGAENGSYSFVLQPRSIQRQHCEYIFAVYPSEKEAKSFDRVYARYYDERNKPHKFKVMDISNCWDRKHFPVDDDWLELKERVVFVNK